MNNFELDTAGVIRGKVQSSKEWYAGYESRNLQDQLAEQSQNIEDYLTNKYSGLNLLSYTVMNMDNPYKPLQEVYDVEIRDRFKFEDQKLQFKPMIYAQLFENPFQLENRQYPVEFPYKKDELYILNLQFPENYTIGSKPEDMVVTFPENAAKFEFRTSVLGNQVQVTSHLQINKRIFLSEEYADLKQFFELIIEKQAETIVFKKSE
jgi:hypothetical protein